MKSKALPTILLGSDHAGYATKQLIMRTLANKGYTLVDVGGFDPEAHDDYPTYAAEVAKGVASDTTGQTKGVLVCGTGTGMTIAANKVKGVRAALVYDTFSARLAREHNDANVIALRGREFPAKKAAALTSLFLSTQFSEGPRHKRRLKEIEMLEKKGSI
jgi:ribose 5-phosphate isomerase B